MSTVDHENHTTISNLSVHIGPASLYLSSASVNKFRRHLPQKAGDMLQAVVFYQ
jgi:hypothetical protein